MSRRTTKDSDHRCQREIDWLSQQLIELLVHKGFIVHKHVAKTGTIYLFIDHGIGSCIRISDHTNKHKRSRKNYRYNLIINEHAYLRYTQASGFKKDIPVSLDYLEETIDFIVRKACYHRGHYYKKHGVDQYFMTLEEEELKFKEFEYEPHIPQQFAY